jgi:hypothetical protein
MKKAMAAPMQAPMQQSPMMKKGGTMKKSATMKKGGMMKKCNKGC